MNKKMVSLIAVIYKLHARSSIRNPNNPFKVFLNFNSMKIGVIGGSGLDDPEMFTEISNENVMTRGGMAGGVYWGSVTSPITLNTYTLKHKFF